MATRIDDDFMPLGQMLPPADYESSCLIGYVPEDTSGERYP
jgi:hypothetical protein